ncbi:MAG: tetratricopeptide repeat protein [Muribaculaceae bacterium]
MENFDLIKQLLSSGRANEAIASLKAVIADNPADDQAHYMLGNAYCRLSDWRNATASYQRAIELNPDSPAVEADKKIQEILNFYCHDLFNP